MNANVFENITLPSLYTQFKNVKEYNQQVIVDLHWKDRNANSWRRMSDMPPIGSFPRKFKAIMRMPMYITQNQIDYNWQAELKITLTQEYMMDANGDAGLDCVARFSNKPFHHHATGKEETSYICLGNIGKIGRQGKVALILPMIALLLNRDETVCHKAEHFNKLAFQHWRSLGYSSINQIQMKGPDGTPINSLNTKNIPFKRV